jgi:formate hydrogenlyase subunit 6/NADH:ubiquinone oxidoreductase subunit I
MKTDLFYYTGTGNSLWTARMLAKELGEAEIIPISRHSENPVLSRAEAIGIVFPVHIWGPPRRVLAFIDALEPDSSRYHFAVALNELEMPSNYIPWGGPGPEAKRIRLSTAAREKIGRIGAVVAARVTQPVEKGPLWKNILFTGLNRLAFSRVPAMDKGFWVDEKCNACGVCKAVCPCGNIDLSAGKPVWLHHCEQCLACIQWCPQEAIQFGKKTPRYERYHHPEVTLKEMIAAANKPDCR